MAKPVQDISKLSRNEVRRLLANQELDPGLMHRLVGLDTASDRRIASHPAALPKTLEKLAQSDDADTVRAVARNPACPPDLLLLVAKLAPLDFFRNPTLDLLILEDPTFPKRIRPGVLRAFIATKDCPMSWLRWAAHYGTKGDQLELLKHPDLPNELLKAVANGPHPKPAERAIDRLLAAGETW